MPPATGAHRPVTVKPRPTDRPTLLRFDEPIAVEFCRGDAHASVATLVVAVARQPQAQVRVCLSVDEHQQRLVGGGGNAVPATVERVGHCRTHHVVEVHKRQLITRQTLGCHHSKPDVSS